MMMRQKVALMQCDAMPAGKHAGIHHVVPHQAPGSKPTAKCQPTRVLGVIHAKTHSVGGSTGKYDCH
jgi:hypothetical protein